MAENRPSKKQRELLNFIDTFIKTNGYGPSYREVMRALDYKSVSTVAVHVDGLIARGLLRKTDNSARSLEVLPEGGALTEEKDVENQHITWLKGEIKKRTSESEIKILREALALLDQPEGKKV